MLQTFAHILSRQSAVCQALPHASYAFLHRLNSPASVLEVLSSDSRICEVAPGNGSPSENQASDQQTPTSTSQASWFNLPGTASIASSIRSYSTNDSILRANALSGASLNFALPKVPNPAVNFRKPEDVIGRSSPLLKSFNKSVVSHQVVHRIMIRPGIKSLLNLLTLYQKKINGIVISAALTKILKTWQCADTENEKKEVAAAALPVLQFLQPFLEFQLRFCSVETIAAILWTWSLLPDHMRSAWSSDLAARCLIRACQPHESGDPRQHKLRGASPKTLSLIVWASPRLIPSGASQTNPLLSYSVKALTSAAARRINQFSPQGLTMFAEGIHQLDGEVAKKLFDAKLAPDAARRIGLIIEKQFRADQLVRLLSAVAAVQLQHLPLFEKAAGALQAQIHRLDPESLVGMAVAFSDAGVRHEGLMAAAVDAVAASRSSYSQEQVQSVIDACGRLKCSADKLAGGQAAADAH